MRLLSTLIIASISLPLWAEPLKLETERERASYGLGYQMGAGFKRQALDLDAAIVQRGLQDGLAGSAPQVSEEAMAQAQEALRQQRLAAQREQAEKAAAAKRAAGQAFLDANRQKPGVVALPSGLQYQVLKAGEGRTPGPRDKVTVHYRGTLIDGSEFDSSYRRQAPSTFPLNGVIAGWTEGLQHMREGAKYALYVPPDLAYGSRGRLAHETLVFEVELLSVHPAEAAQ
ncbi:MAG: FKBP-type peptidyl-prolyl cis-trans isomerase [Pseudomonadota bacterium]